MSRILFLAYQYSIYIRKLNDWPPNTEKVGHTKSRQEPSGAVRNHKDTVRIPSGKPSGTDRNRENYMNDRLID